MKRLGRILASLMLCAAMIILLVVSCSGGSGAPTTIPAEPENSDTQSDTQSVSSEDSSSESSSVEESSSSSEEEPFVPEIYPDTIGIYIPAGDGTAARKLITEFTSTRTAKKDIDCFEILASTEEVAAGSSFASIWNDAWDGHTNTENSKIGFKIDFELDSGETVSKMLLKPSDSDEFFEYLEIYMYDDINQTPGVWYTHLEDEDMVDDTIISSIKLTSGSKISAVGDITLTAFIYNGDDNFDENGNYIGLVSTSITITK